MHTHSRAQLNTVTEYIENNRTRYRRNRLKMRANGMADEAIAMRTARDGRYCLNNIIKRGRVSEADGGEEKETRCGGKPVVRRRCSIPISRQNRIILRVRE